MKTTVTHAQLAALVPAPGQTFDWPQLCDAIPALRAMEDSPEEQRYHAEAWTGLHTRMVLQQLLVDAYYGQQDGEGRFVLFFAALLHDIAKPLTTRIDPDTGRISQPGHSRKGAIDARRLLWYAGTPFALRERICRIIADHQAPFTGLASRSGQTPERIARNLSWRCSMPDLFCVARADMRGRIFHGKQACLDDMEVFEILAREDGCWDGPRAVPDAHTRLLYARGAEIHLDTPAYWEPGSDVIVMCGLPASGKDTWVAKHAKGLPIVSFDDAKAELGLKHGQNDGAAAHYAVDKAKELLRRRAPFVWNATHIGQSMRDRTLDTLYAYGAHVRIVYMEAPPATIYARNSKRDTTLRNAAIEQMTLKWEIPIQAEAHELQMLITA